VIGVARHAARLLQQGQATLARQTYYVLTRRCVNFCEDYGAHDIFPLNIPYDFAVAYRDLALEQLEDEVVSEQLMALPGVGRWTADMLLMFSLGRLDILPIGDLALRKSIRMHYDLPEHAGQEVYLKIAENWRPYRTVASWYYWAAVD